MSISLTWVDAFTDTPFAGNPAGVCLLEEPLPAATMQSLATELGIAETAFVTPTSCLLYTSTRALGRRGG